MPVMAEMAMTATAQVALLVTAAAVATLRRAVRCRTRRTARARPPFHSLSSASVMRLLASRRSYSRRSWPVRSLPMLKVASQLMATPNLVAQAVVLVRRAVPLVPTEMNPRSRISLKTAVRFVSRTDPTQENTSIKAAFGPPFSLAGLAWGRGKRGAPGRAAQSGPDASGHKRSAAVSLRRLSDRG